MSNPIFLDLEKSRVHQYSISVKILTGINTIKYVQPADEGLVQLFLS